MAMDILAYTFGVIALAAAIKCFVDENWGEKMHRESEDITAPDAKDMTQDKKAAQMISSLTRQQNREKLICLLYTSDAADTEAA